MIVSPLDAAMERYDDFHDIEQEMMYSGININEIIKSYPVLPRVLAQCILDRKVVAHYFFQKLSEIDPEWLRGEPRDLAIFFFRVIITAAPCLGATSLEGKIKSTFCQSQAIRKKPRF